jgi:uncharacterized protein YeaO (DUF488 family)
MMATIHIKRVYEPVAKTDGFRVLVDRLWPRGLTAEALHADAWMKELSPSPSLRIWFKHHPEKWLVFCSSYLLELKVNNKADTLGTFFKEHRKITLLYASKDESHNHAVLLQQFLNELQKKVNLR